jgi:glutamine synthetase
MEPEEKKGIAQTAGSLSESLDALQADHEYLLKGGVFSPDLIKTYIDMERLNDVDQIALRPHPYEFMLYYDI